MRHEIPVGPGVVGRAALALQLHGVDVVGAQVQDDVVRRVSVKVPGRQVRAAQVVLQHPVSVVVELVHGVGVRPAGVGRDGDAGAADDGGLHIEEPGRDGAVGHPAVLVGGEKEPVALLGAVAEAAGNGVADEDELLLLRLRRQGQHRAVAPQALQAQVALGVFGALDEADAVGFGRLAVEEQAGLFGLLHRDHPAGLVAAVQDHGAPGPGGPLHQRAGHGMAVLLGAGHGGQLGQQRGAAEAQLHAAAGPVKV